MGEETGEYQTIVEAVATLGELLIEIGEYSEAETCLNEGISVCEKAEDRQYQVYFILPPLALLYLRKGETEKAKAIIGKVHEYASKMRFRTAIAMAETLKGMLFKEQRDWVQSTRCFERSVAEYKSLHAEKWYVYQYADLLYEYGSMYLERSEGDDRDKSKALLNEALLVFRKIGAKKKIEKVEAAMAFIETGEVASKPKSIDCVSTGYADLDKLLHGGVPPNYAVVLTSPSCNERDLLIKSFLETGASRGDVVFHVTISASLAKCLPGKSVPHLQFFVCNPEADAIFKNSSNVQALKGVQNLTDISIALTSAIRQLDLSLKGPRRICLDLVSDVLLQHHAVETRRWLSALMMRLKSEGFTTLAVMDPRMHPSEELYAVTGLFDGEINIYEKGSEKGSERYLKIKRMSDQKYVEDELLLKKEGLQKGK